MASDPTAILFVCLGNICRSPLAEGVFVHRARERGVHRRFEVESAGTGSWHVGERPDPRSCAVAARHGIELPSRARAVDAARDFTRFDWLVCMDDANRETLVDAGAPVERIRLLLEADPTTSVREVPDPYYGGPDGFEHVFALVDGAVGAMLDAFERGEAMLGAPRS